MAGRGRPQFKPTPTLRRKVEQNISCGMSKDECARSIGCSTPTLEKYFATEISDAVANKRSELIGMLFKAARKGNVTAQKQLVEMNRVASAQEAVDPRPTRPARLGKKEEAAIAAQTAGEDSAWGEDLQVPGTVN